MRNKLTIKNSDLIVAPQGLDKFWTLKNKLTIPLNHIVGATLDNGIIFDKKGLRLPGTAAFGYYVGTFKSNSDTIFYNAKKGENIIVIQLKDENYNRLVLSVDNPHEWADKINNL